MTTRRAPSVISVYKTGVVAPGNRRNPICLRFDLPSVCRAASRVDCTAGINKAINMAKNPRRVKTDLFAPKRGHNRAHGISSIQISGLIL